MNLFGVGPAEVVVILIIALIFVGPERLPRLAADIARTIREIRKYTGSIAAEFNEVLQDFERETAQDRGQWKEIGEGLTGATKSVTEAFRGARADLDAAAAPLASPTPPAADPAMPLPPPGSQPPSPNGTGEPVWQEIAEPSSNGAAPASPVEEQR